VVGQAHADAASSRTALSCAANVPLSSSPFNARRVRAANREADRANRARVCAGRSGRDDKPHCGARRSTRGAGCRDELRQCQRAFARRESCAARGRRYRCEEGHRALALVPSFTASCDFRP
jgi:hypothetical protein